MTQTHSSVYEIADYQLPIIKSARRKSIAVKTQGTEVVLEVPKYISKLRLHATLEKHQAWLLQQIDKQVQLRRTVFNGHAAESFEFLGEPYQCLWSTVPPENSRKVSEFSVDKTLGSLSVRFKPHLSEAKKQTLTRQAVAQFFKQEAHDYLQQKVDFYAEQMQLDYQSITIKSYKSRWGSCYPDGRIQFNWRLLQAPSWVVDYVVVHELAHLVHANHSSAFWELVEHYYPPMAAAKLQLKKHGARWIQLLQR